MQQQLKTVGLGIAAGILSGLLGIGGAIIMVPGMVHFLNLPHHTATATSLAVIIPGAIVSALVYNSFWAARSDTVSHVRGRRHTGSFGRSHTYA